MGRRANDLLVALAYTREIVFFYTLISKNVSCKRRFIREKKNRKKKNNRSRIRLSIGRNSRVTITAVRSRRVSGVPSKKYYNVYYFVSVEKRDARIVPGVDGRRRR